MHVYRNRRYEEEIVMLMISRIRHSPQRPVGTAHRQENAELSFLFELKDVYEDSSCAFYANRIYFPRSEALAEGT